MLDVLTIGSATVDHFLTIGQSFSSIKAGDKVLVTHQETHSGGGATNAAAALARLGLKVKTLTKLGNDHDAEFILRELRQYGVENICMNRSKHHTDSATLISSQKDKNRVILVFKEASRDLSVSDCNLTAPNTQWIYLGSLMGKSFLAAKKIVQNAKKKNIYILFNPSLYLAQKGKSYLKSILSATTILVLNKEEAQAVLGTKNPNRVFLLQQLQKLGPPRVIITDGKKRMYALQRKGQEKIMYSLLPPHVKIVDTAGAGDAFTAGFLAGMIKKYSFEDSLRLGQVNASSVIQHIGCKNKLLTEKEARKLMGKFKIRVTRTTLRR